MGEPQFQFPFMETPQPEEQLNLPNTIAQEPKAEKQLDLDLPSLAIEASEETASNPELDLASMDRKALEELYFQKIGNHRFSDRTDDQVRAAILDPEGERGRLFEIDKIHDAWADLGPTGK